MKKVCVFCASASGNDLGVVKAANNLGRQLAAHELTLVYGGAKVGLMGSVADGVKAGGGRVIGVLPVFFKEKEIAHDAIDEMIFVNTMAERKMKMLDISDAFVALPGGFGTLDEVTEVLSLVQLGKYTKPMGFLNINNFFGPLLQLFDNMHSLNYIRDIHKELYVSSENSGELIDKLKTFQPPKVKRWIR